MVRTVRILDAQGRPVRGAKVVLLAKGDEHRGVTRDDGWAFIECKPDWISELSVNGKSIKRDIDLSGGWGEPKKNLGSFRLGSGSARSVRVRYDDGSSARGKLVEFRKGSDAKSARTAENGVARISWEPDWIDALLIDSVLIQRDVDLSGGWFGGSKSELDEITLSRAGARGRRLRLLYRDGEPVAAKVVGFHKGSERELRRTDENGVAYFRWSFDWCDRLEVDQLVVKRDWDLSTLMASERTDLGELRIPRPEDADPRDSAQTLNKGFFEAGQEQGVRGYLYYHDGTLCYESMRVEVEFANVDGKRFAANSNSDGEFFIATPAYRKGGWIKRMFVDGDQIERDMYFRSERSPVYCVVLARKLMRSAKGTKGGLITGRVYDSDGAKAFEAKVSAEVASSGFFSSAQTSTTYADKHGRFALALKGGTRVKRLYVDGSEPSRITLGNPPKAHELGADQVNAGMFNLRLVRKKKMFGLF